MATTVLQHQLRRIQLLLVLGVSFLGGLVFGQDSSGEVFSAVIIYIVLGLIMITISKLQSTSSE